MITLRAVAITDGDALHAIFTEPGVRQFLFDDIVLTRSETQAHVEAARDHGAWTILLDGEVIGLVALRPAGNDRELIIVVSQRQWGRDIAGEAARRAMRHGFEALKLDRIVAAVDLPNDRSHRLMARLGFRPTDETVGPRYRLRRYEALPPCRANKLQ
jgi:ribosomal-protein-alanine N-acetyltransferase